MVNSGAGFCPALIVQARATELRQAGAERGEPPPGPRDQWRRRHMQRIEKLFALALTGLALSAAPALAQQTVKIGSFLSVTGAAAFLGDPELKTLEMYIEKINKEGGLLGRKIELVHYDDGSEANKANSFAKRLLDNDQVDVILGGTTTGGTMAAIPVIEKSGTPFISMAAGV